MKKSISKAIGVVAFAAPLVVGVAYTAGASVGDVGSALGIHNVDQWTLEDGDSGMYTLDREEIDGVVTLVVTGPDGDVVSADEAPKFVGDAAIEFGSDDWIPEEQDVFSVIDGRPCFDMDAVMANAGDDEGFGSEASGPEGTFVLQRLPDGTIDSAYFDGEVSHEVLDAHRNTGALASDMPGAQALGAC